MLQVLRRWKHQSSSPVSFYRYITTETSITAEESISNSQKFRSIVPDIKILAYLDTVRLGTCNKRLQRVAVARKFEALESNPLYKKQLRERQKLPFPFSYPAVYLGQAGHWGQLPDSQFNNPPSEIAIIGRSNVGKSSLLNSLCGYDTSYVQKSAVSNRPGETRSLKFYGLGSKTLINKYQHIANKKKSIPRYRGPLATTRGSALVLVDMPGYGFSFMNDELKDDVMKLLQSYLVYRGKNLKRVLLLVDCRHGIKMADKQFFYELFGSLNDPDTVLGLFQDIQSKEEKLTGSQEEDGNSALTDTQTSPVGKMHWKLQVVLTKCDLVDRSDIARMIQYIRDQFNDILPGYGNMLPIMATSSVENKGFIDLKRQLASLAVESDYSEFVKKSDKKALTMEESSSNSSSSSLSKKSQRVDSDDSRRNGSRDRDRDGKHGNTTPKKYGKGKGSDLSSLTSTSSTTASQRSSRGKEGKSRWDQNSKKHSTSNSNNPSSSSSSSSSRSRAASSSSSSQHRDGETMKKKTKKNGREQTSPEQDRRSVQRENSRFYENIMTDNSRSLKTRVTNALVRDSFESDYPLHESRRQRRNREFGRDSSSSSSVSSSEDHKTTKTTSEEPTNASRNRRRSSSPPPRRRE